MSTVRSGPVTWSQMWWVKGQPASGESSHEDNLHTEVPVEGVPLETVRAAIGDVVRRHENLRSRLDRSCPDRPMQIVDAVGDARFDEVVVVVPAACATEAVRIAKRTCFRTFEQWPIKVLVVADGGMASRLFLVADHWAVDGWGLAVIRRELAEAFVARASGIEWSGNGTVEQPVDVAAWEASASGGGAQMERALRFWHDQLTLIHRELKDFRSVLAWPGSADRVPQFESCRLASRRALRSATAVAERLNVSVSSVFLAAYAAAICAAEQAPAVGVFVLSANRLSGPARRSVRNAILQAPVVLPDLARTGTGFEGNVVSAARQQVRVYRFANADPVATERMWIDVLGDLWRAPVGSAQFNYLSRDSLGAVLDGSVEDGGDGSVRFDEPRMQGPIYMLTVSEMDDRVVMTLRWRDDTGWGKVAEPMLRHIEDLVCRGADPGAVPPPAFAVGIDAAGIEGAGGTNVDII